MPLTRPVTFGEHGMVSTPHYLASAAALDILKEGGTAVDAALAAAAALGTLMPHMTGIGGDAFWLIYHAASDTLTGINGSGTAGRRVSSEAYAGRSEIPARGPLAAITVPGAVDSWRLAHDRFGTLPLSQLLDPAIQYAREGIPVTAGLAGWIRESTLALSEDKGASELFLADGRPPIEGTRLVQSALAKTLSAIANEGPRYFYNVTGQSIARYLGSLNGLLDAADLTDYAARWVEPISVRYRDCTAFQLPPPSQGLAGLLILNFLNGIDISRFGDGSPAYFHTLIQAIKWAFRQRDAWLTDPSFLDIPLDALLDPKAADRDRANVLESLLPYEPQKMGSDTVFLATADAEGNAVGLVQSLYFDFGAAVLDPETGVLLQNRGSFFSLDPAHPNVLAPGKQSASTLMAGMLFRNGKPYLVHGTQGGEVQAQTNISLVTRVVDFGLNVQQAIEAPRVLYGRSWGDAATQLLVETRGKGDVMPGLVQLGHHAEAATWPHPRMGTAQAIRLKGADHAFHEGGADPRGEGLALGY